MKKIKIDNKFYILVEAPGICTLVMEEERTREKKDGTKEQYIFKDRWYLSNVENCLKRYLSLSLEDTSDVKEVLAEIKRVEQTITELKWG